MKAVRPFISRSLWLAALAVLLGLQFWFPDVGPKLPHDTYSVSAEGQKAFYELVRRHVFWVARNRERLTWLAPSLDATDALCILGPARLPDAEEWEAVLEFVENGGWLVFASRGDADFTIPGVEIEFQADSGGLDLLSPETTLVADDADLIWLPQGELIAPSGQTLVEVDGKAQAVVQPHGRGRVVIVSSDFVFSNQSLAWGDNAVLAYRLFTAAGRTDYVYFDESLNAAGTPKVVGILFDPTLRPLTLHLAVLLLVYAWWQSLRFGPLLRRGLTPRHDVVSHTDTVGILYWQSKDGVGVLRLYLKQLIRELRLRSARGQEERILEPIARRMGVDVERLKETFRQASRAAKGKGLDRRPAAALIRRLARIRRAARPARAH